MRKAKMMPIQAYAQAIYKKCECCGRVRDVYYHLNVMDPSNPALIIGGFELCETCGLKIGTITSQNTNRETVMLKYDVGDEI
jgi:hypothetical protein